MNRLMFKFLLLTLAMPLLAASALAQTAALETDDALYYPPRHGWASRPPAELGFDARRLQQAVAAVQAMAMTEPKDIQQLLTERYVGVEPGYQILGPTTPRDGQQRHDHPARIHCRTVGRHRSCRHDLQRGEKLFIHSGRTGCT